MSKMKLRHLADIQNSNVDKVIIEGEQPVRLCNYVDVYKNDFITPDMEFNPGSATRTEIDRFLVKVGDVIITKDSEDRHDIGVPAYVRETADNLVCGYHLTMLRAFKDRADGAFLFWALQSKPAKEAFAIAANGVTRYGLTQEGIKGLPLWVPNLPTQKRITAYLYRETARIDELIAKKERLVEVLNATRAATPLRVMAGGMGVIQYDPTNNRVDFSSLADGWKRVRVKQVAKHMTSGSRGWSDFIQDDGELFLQSGSIDRKMGISFEDSHRVAPQSGVEADRTTVHNGDTLVCITGGRTGAVGFVSGLNERAYINQHVCLIRPSKAIEERLLAQILFSEIGQLHFQMAQYGLKQGMGFEQVANVAIPLPPRDQQESITAAIDAQASKTTKAASQIMASVGRLREYRAALITAAVTGQIDVETYGKASTTSETLDRIEEEMQA